MQDAFGASVAAGDEIVYAVSQGHAIRLVKATVLELPDGLRRSLKVKRTDANGAYGPKDGVAHLSTNNFCRLGGVIIERQAQPSLGGGWLRGNHPTGSP